MNPERREYYRISENVSLDFQVISEQEMQASSLPTQFKVSPFFTLLSQLQELDTDTTHLLRKIAQKDPAMGTFLEVTTNKIDAIAKTIASHGIEFDDIQTQEINLSEGGLSFDTQRQVNSGEYLALKLVFQEACIGLLLYGKVLYSTANEDDSGSSNIGIQFFRMPESSRMIIARHIIALQSKELQLQGNIDLD
ncbi:PilZ domain-containing protein [Aliamphritea hakodatensis]|uniref:PilZ domain-containing protein n=1 Tax=Aliamphritea hakodatensis TaxID=2895352 RepID=UPI0022FD6BEB|nr:PilZ domain-containing protein [Aliamphritea hakodatensis]